MFETLSSNLRKSGDKTTHNSPISTPFKVGVLVVFIFYGQLEQRHDSAWRGWGKESFIFSFLSWLTVRKVLWGKKKALYLSVAVFCTKVIMGNTIFTSPTGDGTAILRGHPSHPKVELIAVQREYLHFSVILSS